jgi:lysophospholipase L1-like esterase
MVHYSNRIRVFIIGVLTVVVFFIYQAPLSFQRPSLPSLSNHQWKASEAEVSSWNSATADTDIHSIDSMCRTIWERSRNLPQNPITQLWNSNNCREGIRRASFQSLDNCWNWEGAVTDVHKLAYANVTENMMDLLQSRLHRSVKVRPHPFVMERVVEIIMNRMKNPNQHPPLRIAVFGGSVTEGFRSRFNSINLSETQNGFQACAWSYKLERVLNQVLPLLFDEHLPASDTSQSFPLVEVKNYAVSGTDSSIGATILEYNLLGADMAVTDVVISSFGANDLQQPIGLERDLVFFNMQRFHTLVKAQRPCSDLPLMIQIADVFEESLTMGSTLLRDRLRYSSEMLESTNWAGVMALSYPDAIRDVIYRNTSDTSLIEYGELHPGMTFHTGIAWMIAYGLLDGALQACDASSLAEHTNPEPRIRITFPILDNNLQAQDVPVLWNNETRAQERLCLENRTAGITCEYQFIAHMLGASNADQVLKAVESVATNINGWEATGYPVRKPRRTWQAMRNNATFSIQLDNMKVPINRLLVLVSNV